MSVFKLIPQSVLLSLLVLMMSCSDDVDTGQIADGGKLFTLLPSSETGIDFSNNLEGNAETNRNVLSYPHYYNGAGVAIGDVNNDGLPDAFFTGNEVPNRLYINKGELRFEDVSEKAGVNPPNKFWSTGAVFVDINGDGYQDIYVCQYGPQTPEERRNLLFINNGDLTFTEKAAEYGLDDPNQSTHAAFFDYDKDGDLDCYVLNESKYVQVVYKAIFEDLKIKENLEAASGKLFRNDGGHFTNVTEQAGVLRYGYGLGLSVSDINKDGWPDIYVANDYSVPDFMFINNGDGTFTDRIKETTRQISFYGMGCDIADYNNDGYPEIAVVDMAATDHYRGKTLMASMDTEGFWYYINNLGYQYQYMFNTFQLNNGNGSFSNIANIAHIAASDWSWAALLADFDNDGWKDYYISTGFRRYSRDNDFMNEMKRIREENGGTIPLNMRKDLYEKMPEIKTENFIYKNNRDLTFKKMSEEWGMPELSYSTGAAYGDLDGDGDLDMLVSNIDHEAFVYRNNASEQKRGNYLRLKLIGETPASITAGAKVTIHYGGEMQYQELLRTRGYEGGMENAVHFGLGDVTNVEEVKIQWPNGKVQTLTGVDANQTLEINEKDAQPAPPEPPHEKSFPIAEVNAADLGIGFVHRENPFNDFAKQVLLPHKQSTLGPKLSVADANGDGLDDFFVGGASGQGGALYFQNPDGTFTKGASQPWAELDAVCEDLDAAFFDADKDGDMDLYIVSGGGGEFEGKEPGLQDRFYVNLDG
ncbi:MAG: VCBS repeat-containing protein, partial [Saprospiraceae bacterium]